MIVKGSCCILLNGHHIDNHSTAIKKRTICHYSNGRRFYTKLKKKRTICPVELLYVYQALYFIWVPFEIFKLMTQTSWSIHMCIWNYKQSPHTRNNFARNDQPHTRNNFARYDLFNCMVACRVFPKRNDETTTKIADEKNILEI